MFGIGMPEFILIMVVALIFIGPKKLPDLARSLGKAMGEFKKATTEIKDSIGIENELSNVKKAFEDMNVRETIDISSSRPAESSQTSDSSPDKEDSKDALSGDGGMPEKEKDADNINAEKGSPHGG